MKSVIGHSTPRIEGEEKVTGKAAYASDVVLPDMLWGKVLRSPVSYAHIKLIDVSKAFKLPGVKAIITGKDLEGKRIGRRIVDMPILAADVVRFIGEKVAAVAAESAGVAEEALDLIEVEYEEIEALTDPLEAIKPSAKLLHPDVTRYRGLPQPLEYPSNTFLDMSWTKGDIRSGFSTAEVIVENTFNTHVVHQGYIEPHSCVVKADTINKGAEIWACSKVPFETRDQLARAVQIEAQKLIIHPCYIGGDFGGKGDFMDIPLCYFLSLQSGCPVKMVMTYDEEFSAGNPKHAAIVKVKTGVMKDGRLVGHEMDFVFDSGAYAAFKPLGLLRGPEKSAGPYNIPHLSIRERLVYTNKVPCGHMRAPGQQQGFFANECQMDLLARELRMDPVTFRNLNLRDSGNQSPAGQLTTHVKAKHTVRRVLEASRYYGPKPKNVGRGIAVTQWLPNGGEGHVFIEIDQDSRVTVSSPCLDQGSGTHTVVCEIIAEELKIPVTLITMQALDTTKVTYDSGVGGSRATEVYGNAAYQAAINARHELLKLAAEYDGRTPDEFVITAGFVRQRHTRNQTSYGQLAKKKGSAIHVHGYYNDTTRAAEASICAQVVELEVSRITGEIRIRQITTAHHTGKIINPLMHQGQIEGGIIMGLGYALMEHLKFDLGKVVTLNFGDYKIPNVLDVPPLKTVIIEEPIGPGPYNSMSIGELPNVPIAAAIANAVHDAVGVRIKPLPITAERILEALRGPII